MGALSAADPVLALLEVLDRDGQPRQSLAVRRWPVRIGRAIDNDLVLADPHVAAHHASVGRAVGWTVATVATDRTDVTGAAGTPDAGGLELIVGDSRNGATLDRRRLAGNARAALASTAGAPFEIVLGRTLLRLRLAGERVAAEEPLAPQTSLARRVVPVAVAGVVVVAGLLFETWLSTDPDGFARAASTTLPSAVIGTGVWCGAWALLSKIVAHRARFGWHLRVFLYAGVAALVVSSLPKLGAFMFSWPWLSGYDFVGPIALAATTLYFHLLAVDPARRRWLKGAAVACAAAGVALSMWFNHQRSGRFGDEAYMSHLFPPALRLARPVPVERLIDDLAALKAPLDRKAREPGDGSDGEGATDDE